MLLTSRPTSSGFTDQNTIEPPAGTGAIWKRDLLSPPVAARTITSMSWFTVCAARLVHNALGSVNELPLVYATSSPSCPAERR